MRKYIQSSGLLIRPQLSKKNLHTFQKHAIESKAPHHSHRHIRIINDFCAYRWSFVIRNRDFLRWRKTFKKLTPPPPPLLPRMVPSNSSKLFAAILHTIPNPAPPLNFEQLHICNDKDQKSEKNWNQKKLREKKLSDPTWLFSHEFKGEHLFFLKKKKKNPRTGTISAKISF